MCTKALYDLFTVEENRRGKTVVHQGKTLCITCAKEELNLLRHVNPDAGFVIAEGEACERCGEALCKP